jgi:hypothetical protein
MDRLEIRECQGLCRGTRIPLLTLSTYRLKLPMLLSHEEYTNRRQPRL